MSPPPTQPAAALPPRRSGPATAVALADPDWLGVVLLVVLTSLVSARTLLAESFEAVELSLLSQQTRALGTTPATTGWLDLAAMAAAAIALARRRGARLSPLVAGFVALLALAALVSSLSANLTRPAVTASASLLTAVITGLALYRLITQEWMLRLLVAALLAGAAVNAAKCLMQTGYEFRETLEHWQQQKAADPQRYETPAAVDFERRMKSAEAFGYVAHPNIAASMLVAALLVASAVAGASLRSAWQRGSRDGVPLVAPLGVGLVVLLSVALWSTGSIGGLLCAALGLAVLIVLAFLRPRRLSAPSLFALVAGGYLGGCALLVWLGWIGWHPHVSIEFRWQYWSAAWQGWLEAPLTGLGRLNFLDAHTAFKPPQSTEEVRDPHNLWVTLLVELGPLGVLAGVGLIASALWAALAQLRHADGIQGPTPPSLAAAARDASAGPAWLASVGVLALAGVLQTTMSGMPFDQPGMAVLWLFELAIPYAIVLLASMRLLAPSSGTPPVALRLGLLAAMLAELVHSLINFLLFTPAGGGFFCALSAAAAARCVPSAQASVSGGVTMSRARIAAALAVVGLQCLLVTAPLAAGVRAARLLQAPLPSTSVSPADPASLVQWVDGVAAADPQDATLRERAARALQQLAAQPGWSHAQRVQLLDAASRLAQQAADQAPRRFSLHASAARCSLALADARRQAGELRAALSALDIAIARYRRAVERYPTEPRLRLELAQALMMRWQEQGDPGLQRAAALEIDAALHIDATRATEAAARLSAQELSLVEQLRSALQAPGASRPAAAP